MSSEAAGPIERIDYYWRPGCGFCRRLSHDLEKRGIEVTPHNIWEDDQAAAVVRSHARGNETVPTVVIGAIGLVNPSIKQLVETLKEHAPHLLPAQ